MENNNSSGPSPKGTRLEQLIYSIAKQAPNQNELWYVEASSEKGNTTLHLQADAVTTFDEPEFRKIHLGFHMYPDTDEFTRLTHIDPPVADWHQPADIFFNLAQKYQTKNALDAQVYISHPETNNGLTVQIQPRDLVFFNLYTQQANQIDSGRSTHCGHWRSGAQIHKMPKSAIPFTMNILDLLGIPAKHGDDYVQANYVQKATTTWEHLQKAYDFAQMDGRDFELSIQLNKEQKYSRSLNHTGSISLTRTFDHIYLGVNFGGYGDSSWDKAPAIEIEKILLMNRILNEMVSTDIPLTNWTIDRSCNGQDRGKKRSEAIRKSLPFLWRMIW